MLLAEFKRLFLCSKWCNNFMDQVYHFVNHENLFIYIFERFLIKIFLNLFYLKKKLSPSKLFSFGWIIVIRFLKLLLNNLLFDMNLYRFQRLFSQTWVILVFFEFSSKITKIRIWIKILNFIFLGDKIEHIQTMKTKFYGFCYSYL